MKNRRGFTLWEMTIVLAIVALMSAIVLPEWVDFGDNAAATPGEAVITLLRDSRKLAIERSQNVAVRLDPSTLYYRVDTTGARGTGLYAEGSLSMSTYETLETDLKRLTYMFRPTGAALGDTVSVRGGEYSIMLAVDPWSGYPVIHAR
jgi:prepilin-type N-terminal cleavage/methylation domain-containing protein